MAGFPDINSDCCKTARLHGSQPGPFSSLFLQFTDGSCHLVFALGVLDSRDSSHQQKGI